MLQCGAFAAATAIALLRRRRTAPRTSAAAPHRRRPRHDWMTTRMIVAHDESTYRRLVLANTLRSDGVIELGSHVGVTTALARGLTDGLVAGVEMSEFSVAAARERYGDHDIEWICADASAVGVVRKRLGGRQSEVTLLLVDVSGSRDPGFVLTLAHKYARCFTTLRLILIKNFKVASIGEMMTVA